MRLRGSIAAFAATLALFATAAAGQPPTLVPLPADLNGQLDGVTYRIRVPANWNGTLLVYAHPYAGVPPIPALVPQPSEEPTLLGRGFALAASRFGGLVPLPPLGDGGSVTKNAFQNIVALTTAFRAWVAVPARTIIWGRSAGALIALGIVEKYPGLFDGAIALCPPAAGMPRLADHKLDVTLAYAAAFGWSDAWGTPGALREDLDFMAEMAPVIGQQLGDAFKGRWEFLRMVNGIPYDASFYETRNYRSDTMWLAVVPRLDLDRRAGGHVAGNIGRVYSLTDEQKAELWETYGLDAEPLLATMNDPLSKYGSSPSARNYAEHYVNPTGLIRRPVITLHTTGDAAAIPNHESAYFEAVRQQGKLGLLVQQFTSGNGMMNTHCTFTAAQELAALDAMMAWLDNGVRPDQSYFPAGLLFVPGYVAPEWRW